MTKQIVAVADTNFLTFYKQPSFFIISPPPLVCSVASPEQTCNHPSHHIMSDLADIYVVSFKNDNRIDFQRDINT